LELEAAAQMTSYLLRLYTDHLAPKSEATLAACNRVIYVREGDAQVRAEGQAAGLAADSAWHGAAPAVVSAGTGGAVLLRWEVAGGAAESKLSGTGVDSSLTLAHAVDLGEPGGYLMRCDRVNFPPGGIAYLHVHRGPGIRCLLKGGLRVEVNGKSHEIAPGNAWFEAGPEPVLALASKTEPTSFARLMLLPREIRGKSSLRYVLPEDADKPKLQTYRIYVDEPIEL
jgi:quercetin dioxygenase-like cupin family protein